MTDGIGRALWGIYEDAVIKQSGNAEGGVAGATLKFIAAFEQDLEDAKIDIYNKLAVEEKISVQAKIRRARLRSS